MWLDRISNQGPLALKLDALPTALHGPALTWHFKLHIVFVFTGISLRWSGLILL